MIFTVGHSNRGWSEFLQLLISFGIEHLVDVRTIPRSRHNPQFNQDSLPLALQQAGIRYTHLAELGGLRKPRPDSINKGWQNESFRGYADYMQTPEFEAGLEKAIQISENEKIAIMCAEAVPWRCHRSLIGDALAIRNFQVVDIIGPGKSQPHRMTPFARVIGSNLVYPEPIEENASDEDQNTTTG